MAALTEVFGRRRNRLQVVIQTLEDTPASPAVFEGTSYSASQLPTLYTLLELLDVKAAIAAVMRNQAYTMGGVSFTKANLRELRDRERELDAQVNPARRGFGVREAIPR